MATYRSIPAFQKAMKAKARELRRGMVKTAFQAAVFMETQAISLAPLDTGKLIEGIRRKKTTNGYEVSSTVPGNFPYNLWVNRTAPYRTLNFPIGGKIPPSRSRSGGWRTAFPKGSKIVYGIGPYHWTGTPRFWHFSTVRTKDKYVKLAKANIKSALQVTT